MHHHDGDGYYRYLVAHSSYQLSYQWFYYDSNIVRHGMGAAQLHTMVVCRDKYYSSVQQTVVGAVLLCLKQGDVT